MIDRSDIELLHFRSFSQAEIVPEPPTGELYAIDKPEVDGVRDAFSLTLNDCCFKFSCIYGLWPYNPEGVQLQVTITKTVLCVKRYIRKYNNAATIHK